MRVWDGADSRHPYFFSPLVPTNWHLQRLQRHQTIDRQVPGMKTACAPSGPRALTRQEGSGWGECEESVRSDLLPLPALHHPWAGQFQSSRSGPIMWRPMRQAILFRLQLPAPLLYVGEMAGGEREREEGQTRRKRMDGRGYRSGFGQKKEGRQKRIELIVWVNRSSASEWTWSNKAIEDASNQVMQVNAPA